MSLSLDVLRYASALGFDRAAILPVGRPRYAAEFTAWLANGYYGEMTYLVARAAERLDPTLFAPEAASMILLIANYDPGHQISPASDLQAARGRIARYAIWPDYHTTLKPRLYALDAFIRERTGRRTLGKVFVDAAPVLERDFAEQAGLGFIGRNTCLITPGLGSWTFLAGLMVPEVLEAGRWASEAERGASGVGSRERRASSLAAQGHPGCGRCRRCLDACPTQAFVGPHVLDARRCISYLTIELRGPIPRALRPLMGNWVFGCDVCQEVCPYNRGGRTPAVETVATSGKSTAVDSGLVGAGRLYSRSRDLQSPGSHALSELLALDEAGFRARFRGTPVLRAKRRGLVRNACVAAGNSGDPSLVPSLIPLLSDPEPVVRGHAAWALGCIGGPVAQEALSAALAQEADPWVREEIALAGESGNLGDVDTQRLR